MAEIDTLCLNAMKLYPDVHIAGLDVLLTQKLTPYIIEINGRMILFIRTPANKTKFINARFR